MAAETITLTLVNKGPRNGKEQTPYEAEVSVDSTLQDVKSIVARKLGVWDANQIGLVDPSTDKLLKDRQTRIHTLDSVMKSGKLSFKDLGPQVEWRTVFLVEYLGPILIHTGVVAARPLIYQGGSSPMSQTQMLTYGMILAHFVKRELETLYVHRFGSASMPALNIIKNSAYYWGLSGALVAYFVYSPWSEAALASNQMIDLVGLLLFMFGQISNAMVHLNLARMRPEGTTVRAIPRGYGFNLVTCPNYMFEVVAWIGIIAVSRSWTVLFFISCGTWQMKQWAWQKEKAYRTEFGDKYKKHRYTMLPGLF